MDAEVKAQWVEALRSGKYKQAKGVLHKVGGGYCCLGVLCDVLGKEWIEPLPMVTVINGRDVEVACYGITHGGGVARLGLPYGIMQRIGLQEISRVSRLMDMNDSGQKFETIADYIERAL